MNQKTQCEILAQKIADIFRKGLQADADLIHYIRSALSDTDELAEILTDEDHADNPPLLELIFFPDESIQTAVEAILEEGDYQNADCQKISEMILKNISSFVLCFPDGEKLHFSPPFRVVEGFVKRLGITKKTDRRLIQAIAAHIPQEEQVFYKVRLRNSRFIPNEKNVAFLCNFLERIPKENRVGKENISGLFGYVLRFLGETGEGEALYKALMESKKRCFRCLQQARSFEEHLGKGNMEILMLQGIRPPQMSREAALNEMSMIDRIAYAVFGRSEHMAEADIVSNDIFGENDMENMVRKMADLG